MNKNAYLRRLQIAADDLAPTLKNLKLLQRNHLLMIPFENLDIGRKRPITLDVERFFEKIVLNKRGGFCYELNGLFNELLKEIGYRTKLISARVANDKGFGAEYDHLAILTEIDGETFLTDVGFGDFTSEPLRFVLNEDLNDETGTFRFARYDDEYLEIAKINENQKNIEYIFKDRARDLNEFAEMCAFHQTSPESHFTRGRVCSIMTANGRRTLTDKRFIETLDGARRVTEIDSDEEFDRILKSEFAIATNSI